MSKTRRLLALLMAILMMVNTLPLTAIAEAVDSKPVSGPVFTPPAKENPKPAASVMDLVTGIVINGPDTVAALSTIKLGVTLEPAGINARVAWSSTNPVCAVVDDNGNVTGVNAGEAVIKATAELLNDDGSFAGTLSASKTITVTKASGNVTADFTVLKDPARNPEIAAGNEWFSYNQSGSIDVSDIPADYWKNNDYWFDNVAGHITAWPAGFANGMIRKNGDANGMWHKVFNHNQKEIAAMLGVSSITADDVGDIKLIPYRIEKSGSKYIVGCLIAIDMPKLCTVTYYLWDYNNDGYIWVSGATVKTGSTTSPTVDTPAEKWPDGKKYQFTGWFTDAALTKSASFPYTVNGNVQFYAKYMPAAYNKLTYDLNGGSWSMAAPKYEFYQSGKTVQLQSEEPTVDWGVFAGWVYNWEQNKVMKPGQFLTMGDSDITLQAKYLPYRNINYNLNGGTWTEETSTRHAAGEIVNLPSAVPTRQDYTFGGWEMDGKTYAAGSAVAIPEYSDLYLSAKWVPQNCTYTVRYIVPAGIYGEEAVDVAAPVQKTALAGTRYDEQPLQFDGLGYTGMAEGSANNWGEVANGLEIVFTYQPGQRNYHVRYVTGDNGNVTNIKGEEDLGPFWYGQQVNFVIPEIEGYIFDAIYINDMNGGTVADPTAPWTIKDDNRYYLIHYNRDVKLYTVTWVNYDGTELKADEGVEEGTLPQYTGDEPTRAADAEYTYTFSGWDPAVAEVTGDVTYTAVYTAVPNSYTVTYEYTGNVPQDAPALPEEPMVSAYGDEVTAMAVDAVEGYAFSGWTIKDGEEAITDGVFTMPARDITLTGSWERTYTVRYRLGAALATGKPEDQVIAESAAERKVTETVPVRFGYSFLGWAESAEGEAVYQPGDALTLDYEQETRELTLYAVWAKKTYTMNVERGYYNEGNWVVFDTVDLPAGRVANNVAASFAIENREYKLDRAECVNPADSTSAKRMEYLHAIGTDAGDGVEFRHSLSSDTIATKINDGEVVRIVYVPAVTSYKVNYHLLVKSLGSSELVACEDSEFAASVIYGPETVDVGADLKFTAILPMGYDFTNGNGGYLSEWGMKGCGGYRTGDTVVYTLTASGIRDMIIRDTGKTEIHVYVYLAQKGSKITWRGSNTYMVYNNPDSANNGFEQASGSNKDYILDEAAGGNTYFSLKLYPAHVNAKCQNGYPKEMNVAQVTVNNKTNEAVSLTIGDGTVTTLKDGTRVTMRKVENDKFVPGTEVNGATGIISSGPAYLLEFENENGFYNDYYIYDNCKNKNSYEFWLRGISGVVNPTYNNAVVTDTPYTGTGSLTPNRQMYVSKTNFTQANAGKYVTLFFSVPDEDMYDGSRAVAYIDTDRYNNLKENSYVTLQKPQTVGVLDESSAVYGQGYRYYVSMPVTANEFRNDVFLSVPKKEFKVAYDFNGGSVIDYNHPTYHLDDIFVVGNSKSIPTREGYVFAGWDLIGQNGKSAKLFKHGEPLTIRDWKECVNNERTFHLRAKWIPEAEADEFTVQIRVFLPGETDPLYIYTKQTTKADFINIYAEDVHQNVMNSGVTLPVNFEKKFALMADKEVAWDDLKVPGTGLMQVDMVYKPVTYTVTYNLNGGTSKTEQLVYTGLQYGDATPVIAQPTKANGNFTGWSCAIENSSLVLKGIQPTVTGNTVYTAAWGYPLTIHYYYEGTTDKAFDDYVGYYAPGEQYNVHETAKTLAGYTRSHGGLQGIMPERALELTITFKQNVFTVTWLDWNDDVLRVDAKVPENTVPQYGDDPVRPATEMYTYTFTGWTPEVTAVKGNVTYKATYSETVNQYTLSYEYTGTVPAEAAVLPDAPTTHIFEEEIVVIAVDDVEGYVFSGWTMKDTGEAVTGEVLSMPGRDITLTGDWQRTYTVRYELGASRATGKPADQVIAETVPAEDRKVAADVPVRFGFNFLGWAEQAGGEAVFQPEAQLTLDYEQQVREKTLYAVWQKKSYTVPVQLGYYRNGEWVKLQDAALPVGRVAGNTAAQLTVEGVDYTYSYAQCVNPDSDAAAVRLEYLQAIGIDAADGVEYRHAMATDTVGTKINEGEVIRLVYIPSVETYQVKYQLMVKEYGASSYELCEDAEMVDAAISGPATVLAGEDLVYSSKLAYGLKYEGTETRFINKNNIASNSTIKTVNHVYTIPANTIRDQIVTADNKTITVMVYMTATSCQISWMGVNTRLYYINPASDVNGWNRVGAGGKYTIDSNASGDTSFTLRLYPGAYSGKYVGFPKELNMANVTIGDVVTSLNIRDGGVTMLPDGTRVTMTYELPNDLYVPGAEVMNKISSSAVSNSPVHVLKFENPKGFRSNIYLCTNCKDRTVYEFWLRGITGIKPAGSNNASEGNALYSGTGDINLNKRMMATQTSFITTSVGKYVTLFFSLENEELYDGDNISCIVDTEHYTDMANSVFEPRQRNIEVHRLTDTTSNAYQAGYRYYVTMPVVENETRNDIFLTAPKKAFGFRYDFNGGTAIDYQQGTYCLDEVAIIGNSKAIPVRTGYVFQGWELLDDSNARVTVFNHGKRISINDWKNYADASRMFRLRAIWTPEDEADVFPVLVRVFLPDSDVPLYTYTKNTAKTDYLSIYAEDAHNQVLANVTNLPEGFERKFALMDDMEVAWEDLTDPATGLMTVDLVYKPITYTVRYDLNGGSSTAQLEYTGLFFGDATPTIPDPKGPSVFIGWHGVVNNNGMVLNSVQSKVTGNTVYTAVWGKPVTIHYYYEGTTKKVFDDYVGYYGAGQYYNINESTKNKSGYTRTRNEISGVMGSSPVEEIIYFCKNEITLTANSATAAYNGAEHTASGYVMSNAVAGNPNKIKIGNVTYTVTVTNPSVSAVAAGTYTNKMDTQVVVKNGSTDVTKEFTIKRVDGQLVINGIDTPITITADTKTKVYDGQPLTSSYTYTEGVLLDGDELQVEMSGEATDYTEKAVTSKVVSWKVMRGDVDVTSSYTFTQPVDGSLTVTKRPVTLASATDSKPFDGTALTNSTVTFEDGTSFVSGEASDWTATGSVTYMSEGEVENTITFTKGEGYKDSNYTITLKPGKLSINKSEAVIAITANSKGKIYDGKKLTDNGYTVTFNGGDLPADYTVNATVAGEITNVTEGGVANAITGYTVLYKGNNVTASFEPVQLTNGTLTITPRTVTLTSADDSKPFDGTALKKEVVTATEFNAETGAGFISGEGVTYSGFASITNPGEVANAFTYTIKNGTKAENYTITPVYGTLTVTENTTAILVKANSNSKTYDGTALTDSGYTVTGTLPDGYTLTAVVEGSATNVEQTAAVNEVKSYQIKDTAGNDVTLSFTNVSTENGTLTITPRKVVLVSATDSKPFDGTSLTNSTVTFGEGTSFVNGEASNWTATGSVTYMTKDGVENSITFTKGKNYKDDNYDIVLQPGTLSITQSNDVIAITADSNRKTYDGQPLTDDGYTVTFNGGKLPADYVVTATVEGTITDVTSGGAANKVTGYTITHKGTDVTGSFAPAQLTDGTLTIDARKVILSSETKSKPYDGTALTASTVSYVENTSFVTGEVTAMTATGSVTTKGEGNVTNTITYTTGAGFKADNYNIELRPGTLSITDNTNAITVTAFNAEKFYDGTALTDGRFTYTGALPAGHTLNAVVSGSATHVTEGGVANVVDSYTITDANGQDVTANFSGVSKINGTLTIKPRTVTLTSADDSKTYDGTDLTAETVTPTAFDAAAGTGFVAGEGVSYGDFASIRNYGETGNTFSYTFNSNTAANDYVITPEYGKLSIGKRSVTLTSATDEKMYDGTALTAEDVTVGGEGFAAGEGAAYESFASLTYVGQAENEFVYTLNSGTLADNYTISTANGTLTVTEPDTGVVTKAHEDKVYAIGETIEFTITAQNVYNVPVDITLREQDGVTFTTADTFTAVKPGAIVTARAEHMVTEADAMTAGSYANTVEATVGTRTWTADDAALLVNAEPALNVTKTVTSAPEANNAYKSGETVTFDITVTNEGNVTLTNVTVTEEMAGAVLEAGTGYTISGGKAVIDTMAPGEAVTVKASYLVKVADVIKATEQSAAIMTNTVSVTADEVAAYNGSVTPAASAQADFSVGEWTNVTITLNWVDGDGFYRPNAANVLQLVADGTVNDQVAMVPAASGDQWQYTFIHKNVYSANGTPVTYTVAQPVTPGNGRYDASAEGLTVTNRGYIYITFANWNGEVLSWQRVAYGTSGKEIAQPVREGYSFIGWRGGNWLNVSRDQYIRAEFIQRTEVPTGTVIGDEPIPLAGGSVQTVGDTIE